MLENKVFDINLTPKFIENTQIKNRLLGLSFVDEKGIFVGVG